MHTTSELADIVKLEIEKLNFNLQPIELYEPIGYTMSLGGKRLRPVLVLMACEMFGGDISKANYPALGIELFHNFTLIHDDLMDNAPIRRNKTTVFKKWNSNIAILSGDAMFAKAYELVAKTENDILQRILTVFTQTAIEVCEGQQYDMNYETMDNVSIDDYIKMIRLKTAVLIAASLKVGALIAGASEKDANSIYEFGINMGLTFQLQDDLLDVYSDVDKFGKTTGGDIVTNKKTYLYLKAFELAKDDDFDKLKYYFSSTDFDNTKKIEEVTNIYNRLCIKQHTKDMMNYYYQKSLDNLSNIALEDSRKSYLKKIADDLMDREY
ncbi:MAG: polyprenyl synthetase family protein [Bacteroidota bacterium]